MQESCLVRLNCHSSCLCSCCYSGRKHKEDVPVVPAMLALRLECYKGELLYNIDNSHIFMPADFRHAYVLTSLLCRKCYRASYHSTSYRSSYYVTTYYRVTSQGSSTYRCGSWFRRRRCTRYHTYYHQR